MWLILSTVNAILPIDEWQANGNFWARPAWPVALS
jgi:hypothetical protein